MSATMPEPAKKATKKAAAKPKVPRYRVTSDRCTLGARGDIVELSDLPRSLLYSGHLEPVKDT